MNWRQHRPDILMWLLFAVITAVGLYCHDMWRDEWQAILLSYQSHSLADLWINIKDEGHPILWYLLLFMGKYLGPAEFVPKVINYLIGLGYAWLILLYAPFKRIVKYGLTFGYFLVFEYNAISRNYGISLLLIFGLLVLWHKRTSIPIQFAALLFLLTQTTIYGAIMALAFTMALITESFVRNKNLKMDIKDVLFTISSSVGFFICLICAKRVSFDTNVNVQFSFDHLLFTLSTFYDSYFPLPEFTHNCWNSIWPNGYILRGLLALPLLIFGGLFLFKNKPPFLFWLSYTCAHLLFAYIFFPGYSRHIGYMYIAGLSAAWLFFDSRQKIAPLNSIQKTFVLIIVFVQVGVGTYFIYDNITSPFSESHHVADFLKDNKLDKLPIYGSYHYCMTGISGYLQKPVYHLDDMKPYTYMPWQKLKVSHESQSDSILAMRLPEIEKLHDSSIVLLTFPSAVMDSLQYSKNAHIHLLQTFNNSNELYENFLVFLITK